VLNTSSTRNILFIAALLGFGLPSLQAVAQDTKTTETETPEATPVLPSIIVTTVSKVNMQDRVLASGLIGPVERVQVQPLIEGQPIESLEVDVGDTVQKDQVLARLSNVSLALQESQFLASMASAQASIAQAEASKVDTEATAAEAKRVADRTEKLRQQGSATQAAQDTAQAAAVSAAARVAVATQTLEAARAQLALTEAQLANIRLQQARTEIRSPVAGEVLERNALVGSIATASGAAMFVIMKDGALEVGADVAEADLLKVAKGQKAELRFGADQKSFGGTVRLVEPGIDLTTRQGRARITLDEPQALRSGMFMNAEIIVAERETLVVPLTAVSATPEGTRVMRIKGDTVEAVIVKTGIRQGGLIEVLEGLNEGDTVVKKAGAFVRPGDVIKPVVDDTPVN
jgi:HlyD family secretion protein